MIFVQEMCILLYSKYSRSF